MVTIGTTREVEIDLLWTAMVTATPTSMERPAFLNNRSSRAASTRRRARLRNKRTVENSAPTVSAAAINRNSGPWCLTATVRAYTAGPVAALTGLPTCSPPRNLAGNPDSPQAVIFLTSITDVMMGS